MSQPNTPTYGVDVLNKFPIFTTQSSYKQTTGQDAPTYDVLKPIKEWFDPNAGADGNDFVLYTKLVGTTFSQFVFPVSIAKSINIPPDGPTDQNHNPLYPTPVRNLIPNEQFFIFMAGFIPVTMIKRTDLTPDPSTPPTDPTIFSLTDRNMLQAIFNAVVQVVGK